MDTAAWLARKLGQAPPPQQQYQQQPQQQQPQQYPQQQPQQQQYIPPDEKITAMQAVAEWRGGQGVRSETQSCPNCGSTDKYFSREHLRDKRAGAAPSPICMACGYTNLFEQQSGNTSIDDKAPVINDRRSMMIHQETQALKEQAMRNM